jgi:hypothetical protein
MVRAEVPSSENSSNLPGDSAQTVSRMRPDSCALRVTGQRCRRESSEDPRISHSYTRGNDVKFRRMPTAVVEVGIFGPETPALSVCHTPHVDRGQHSQSF